MGLKISKIIDKITEVEIVIDVLMEAFFVLTKFHKLPKVEVISDLKTMLSFEE